MLVDITTVIGSSSLFIRDADRNDRGIYTVEAKNSSGTTKVDVLVRVQGKFIYFNVNMELTFIYVDVADFRCFCDVIQIPLDHLRAHCASLIYLLRKQLFGGAHLKMMAVHLSLIM